MIFDLIMSRGELTMFPLTKNVDLQGVAERFVGCPLPPGIPVITPSLVLPLGMRWEWKTTTPVSNCPEDNSWEGIVCGEWVIQDEVSGKYTFGVYSPGNLFRTQHHLTCSYANSHISGLCKSTPMDERLS